MAATCRTPDALPEGFEQDEEDLYDGEVDEIYVCTPTGDTYAAISTNDEILGGQSIDNLIDWKFFKSAIIASKIHPSLKALVFPKIKDEFVRTQRRSVQNLRFLPNKFSVASSDSLFASKQWRFYEISPGQLTASSWLLRHCSVIYFVAIALKLVTVQIFLDTFIRLNIVLAKGKKRNPGNRMKPET
ncbi:hypothetical protein CRG98_000551 [Punica granatum]|uniref:Uncharacterized protein n=1 Tax=Punica granatum TaxID=22663 RepID=A0A2I0LEI9_PUNGR|nr:hypothetical protein CRG98_000551 [Punica granatum]